MFTALLDTNVLWPSLQRDFLLSLAVERIYRPIWSAAILAELAEHETRKLLRRGWGRDVATTHARSLVTEMGAAFGGATITGWDGLDGTYGLPDPDDEHVVAAAVVGGAGAIVTHNVRDFPSARVPGDIQVLTPAVFALDAVSLQPVRAHAAVAAIAARSGRYGPQWTVQDVLDCLSLRYGMTQVAEQIRLARGLFEQA